MSDYLKSRPTSEHNDCAVIAFSHAMELDYSIVHDIMKKGGRQDRRGTYIDRVLKVGGGSYQKKAKTIKGRLITYHERTKGQTIQKFLKKNPTGRFVCIRSGHAFAVIDGVVYNQKLDKSIIKYYYKIKIK